MTTQAVTGTGFYSCLGKVESSGAQGNQNTLFNEEEIEQVIAASALNDKRALIIQTSPKADHNGAFSPECFGGEINQIAKEYKISRKVVVSKKDLISYLENQTAEIYDRVVIAGHGKLDSICLDQEYALERGSKEIKLMGKCLKKEGDIVLTSCSTGEGQKNIARYISQTLGKTVYAPYEAAYSSKVKFSSDRVSFYTVRDSDPIDRVYRSGKRIEPQTHDSYELLKKSVKKLEAILLEGDKKLKLKRKSPSTGFELTEKSMAYILVYEKLMYCVVAALVAMGLSSVCQGKGFQLPFIGLIFSLGAIGGVIISQRINEITSRNIKYRNDKVVFSKSKDSIDFNYILIATEIGNIVRFSPTSLGYYLGFLQRLFEETKTMSIFQTEATKNIYSYEDIEHYKVYARIFQMTPYVLGPDAKMPSKKSDVLMIKARSVNIDTIDLGSALFLNPQEDKVAKEIQGMLADRGSIIFHVDRNKEILEGRTTNTWMPEVFYELSRKMPTTMIYVLDSSIVDIEYKEEQGEGYFNFYDNRGMVRSTFYGGRRGTAEDFVYRKAFESIVEDLEEKMKQLMKENEELKKRAV